MHLLHSALQAVFVTGLAVIPAQALDQTGCDALTGQTFEADVLDIPSGAATIDSARMLQPAGETKSERGARVPATPEYCQVNGRIAPVGDTPDIGFQINLPADWNGKVVQYGGGGFKAPW